MTTLKIQRASGVRAFAVICLGQFFTLLGSNLSSFGLGVWVYLTTGSATKYALISFFIMLPGLMAAPLAGTLVDRWDRRWTIILSDAGDTVTKLLLAYLVWSHRIEIWHLYVILPFSAISHALQVPAFAAATPLLVAKRHLTRASGAMQAATSGALVLAPLAAGALFDRVGLLGLIGIDLTTAVLGIGTLLAIRIPKPPARAAEAEPPLAEPSLLRETLSGWLYIKHRTGLLHLLLLVAFINVSMGTVQVLLTPMVLSFASAAELGIVLSSASAGMLLGSLVTSAWGGPTHRILGIFTLLCLQAVILSLGVVRPHVELLSVGAFGFLFFRPTINACNQALWQSKVPPDLQGRVFAMRGMVASISLPFSVLLAGPLADHVFEPLLRAGGPLAGSVGRLLGVGPGRGIALLFIVLAFSMLLAVVVAFRNPRIRYLETELPDVIADDLAEVLSATAETERSSSSRTPPP